MFLDILLVTVLAVINASIPAQDFPIDVTITPIFPQGEEAAVSSSSEAATAEGATAAPAAATGNIVIDAALLTTVLGTVGGLFATWKQSQKKTKENAEKVDAVADSAVNIKESLKATDKGSSDTAAIVAQVVAQLRKKEDLAPLLENCAPAAKQNAEDWKEDVKEYYDNTGPTTSQDVGLDNTRAKLVEVNKQTKPTPDA